MNTTPSHIIVSCLILALTTQFCLGKIAARTSKYGERANEYESDDGSQIHPIMYEISTRPWLYELSQKYGKTIKLANVPTEEIQALKGEYLLRRGSMIFILVYR